jgi:quercetin dioxygenase-like cupin family protein
MEKLHVPVSFADERGEIIDLVDNEDINAVTIITFTEGAVRGNHYHRETYQWNYILSGRIKVVSQEDQEPPKEVVLEEGDMLLTVPNVKHALVGMEPSRLLVITKGPRAGRDYENDTFRLDTPLA